MRICAELASNHGGDWDWIVDAVVGCSRADVDVVKVQAYQTKHLRPWDAQYDWLDDSELSLMDLERFHGLCRQWRVMPLATVFDVERPAQLRAIGYDAVKVGSGDSMRADVVEACCEHFLTVYLSTGLLGVKQVQAIVEAYPMRVVPVHAVPRYPTSPHDAQLSRLSRFAQFTPRVGYSDHTIGIKACVAAMAMGVEYCEKHLRLARGRQRPWDAGLDEWHQLVAWRDAIVSLGSTPSADRTFPEAEQRFVGRWTYGT